MINGGMSEKKDEISMCPKRHPHSLRFIMHTRMGTRIVSRWTEKY